MPHGQYLTVGSFREAQRRVPFPVHRPLVPASRISVRPWSARLWPTVSSLHQFRGASIRLKQFVDPWGLSEFPPLLSYMAGNPGGKGDHLYGPPLTVFRVDGAPVAHAGHFYGKEAGLTFRHLVQLDLVVLEGRLGVAGVRAFFKGLAWADPQVSPARYRRPVHEWSWELHERRSMWSWPRAKRWSRRLSWTGPVPTVPLADGRSLRPPSLPGFRLDSVGVGQDDEGTEFETRLIYRPRTGHAPVVAAFLRGVEARKLRGGPIYRVKRVRLSVHPTVAVRAPSVGSSRIEVALGSVRLVLTVPPSSRPTRANRDLRIAARFVQAFDRGG